MNSSKIFRRRRFLRYVSLATVTMLFTASCNRNVSSSGNANSPDTTNVEATDSKTDTKVDKPGGAESKIRVGYQTGDINNVTMVAFNEGYFKEAGLDVELVPFGSGADMIPALGGGVVDVTWFFPFPALSAFARDIPIEVFLVDHAPRSAERLLARGIDSTAKLKGKKIGVTFGTTGHYFTLQALKKANLSERDVTLVNLKPAGMTPAYSAKQIDAAWTWEPASGKIIKMGANTLETVESVGGYAAAIWAVRKPFAQENPEAIQKFIQAWYAAQQAYLKDSRAKQRWEAKRLNLSEADFAAMVERQGTRVVSVREQLSNAWLGKPGKAKETDLYKTFEKYGKFLQDLDRIKKAPDDYSPLINSSYIQNYLTSISKI